MEFQEIYNAYVSKVYSYIKYKIKDIHLVEDIVQDTFISIYKDMDKIVNVKNIKGYIFTIAHRRMVDRLRKIKSDEVNIDDLYDECSYDISPNDSLFIEELLNKLDHTSSQIIYGIYVEKLTYKQLSEMLNIPEGTVKSKCYYARLKLREWLEEEEYEQ